MIFKKYLFRSALLTFIRSSHREVFIRKGVLKISSNFTREHPCRSVISIKLQSKLVGLLLYLLHIFRTPFPRNTSAWLLLNYLQNMRIVNHYFHFKIMHDDYCPHFASAFRLNLLH